MRVPLIMSGRNVAIHELASWFGNLFERVEIIARCNLVLNIANMVKNGPGATTCVDLDYNHHSLAFVPFSQTLKSGTVLVWKRIRSFLGQQ